MASQLPLTSLAPFLMLFQNRKKADLSRFVLGKKKIFCFVFNDNANLNLSADSKIRIFTETNMPETFPGFYQEH